MGKNKYDVLKDNMLNGYAYYRVIPGDSGDPEDYVFLEVNEAFEEMTALKASDILGKKVTEVFPEIKGDAGEWLELYREAIITGQTVKFEKRSKSLKKWFLISAFSVDDGFFATVFEDITDTKDASRLWGFAQLGRIAREMAHDVNNPLQIISGRAHLLLMDNRGNKELERNIKIIRQQCDKARGVVEEMLKFFEERPGKGKGKGDDRE